MAGRVGSWACFIFTVLAVLAVPRAEGRNLRATPEFEATSQCPSTNMKLATWLQKQIDENNLVPKAKLGSFEEFLKELKYSLDAHRLPTRPVEWIAREESEVHPTCAGDWMEFGVFRADMLNFAAKHRMKRCGPSCPPVIGFDTFTGLPEAWARDKDRAAAQGAFSLGGNFPPTRENTLLVKGLFSDSLPPFLKAHDQHAGNSTLSYLHIDCDLYAGARDALMLLSDRIKPGTVIIFDDLVNYNNYREHEVKALYEWLQATGAQLAVYGMLGPLRGKEYSMDLNPNEPNGEHPWFQQSAGFVVAHKDPLKTLNTWSRPMPIEIAGGVTEAIRDPKQDAKDWKQETLGEIFSKRTTRVKHQDTIVIRTNTVVDNQPKTKPLDLNNAGVTSTLDSGKVVSTIDTHKHHKVGISKAMS